MRSSLSVRGKKWKQLLSRSSCFWAGNSPGPQLHPLPKKRTFLDSECHSWLESGAKCRAHGSNLKGGLLKWGRMKAVGILVGNMSLQPRIDAAELPPISLRFEDFIKLNAKPHHFQSQDKLSLQCLSSCWSVSEYTERGDWRRVRGQSAQAAHDCQLGVQLPAHHHGARRHPARRLHHPPSPGPQAKGNAAPPCLPSPLQPGYSRFCLCLMGNCINRSVNLTRSLMAPCMSLQNEVKRIVFSKALYAVSVYGYFCMLWFVLCL